MCMRRAHPRKRKRLALRHGTRGGELSEPELATRSALRTGFEKLDRARTSQQESEAARGLVGIERAAVLLGGGAQLVLLLDRQRVEHAARDRRDLSHGALAQGLELLAH